jgi:hypothetical protein
MRAVRWKANGHVQDSGSLAECCEGACVIAALEAQLTSRAANWGAAKAVHAVPMMLVVTPYHGPSPLLLPLMVHTALDAMILMLCSAGGMRSLA